MTQTAIPFHFMRGGTSRGPYFNRADLPTDRDTLNTVLIAAVGAGHPLNIDGLGGGAAVTTKVAMLSPSEDDWSDVDYLFAQVSVTERHVDYTPTCGNILVGVGPAAIEMGLVAPTGDVTEVRIRAVNTGARVIAKVRTKNGAVVYDGDTAIDGVPGTAAPVELMFLDVVGGATGALFPTGQRRDMVGGVEVTCMDVAMPMVIAQAADFGLSGYETAAELDENRAFFARMEAIRIEAGARMGLGDVTSSVVPKFAVLAPARAGGHVATRYFMPWKCHPSLAVTGSQCVASCLLCPGTIAQDMADLPNQGPTLMKLEHPMGVLEVMMEYHRDGSDFDMRAAGLVRTARKIAAGEVYVPKSVWVRD